MLWIRFDTHVWSVGKIGSSPLLSKMTVQFFKNSKAGLYGLSYLIAIWESKIWYCKCKDSVTRQAIYIAKYKAYRLALMQSEI